MNKEQTGGAPGVERDGRKGAGGTPPIESVRRALRVLGAFGPDRNELGISDLANELAMHKSTVHRLLATLEQEGFVRQTATGRYALTWRLIEIAAAIPLRDGIRYIVLKHLGELVTRTGETAHLAVLHDGAVLYIEKVEGTHRLRMPSAVGRSVPVHATSLGKVLLAGLTERDAKQLVFSQPLLPMTHRTITSPDQLIAEIRQVRDDGYAVDNGEIEEGLMCIAAPIYSTSGETGAAISIAGPSNRLEPIIDSHAEHVRETARQLSTELGPVAARLRETWSL